MLLFFPLHFLYLFFFAFFLILTDDGRRLFLWRTLCGLLLDLYPPLPSFFFSVFLSFFCIFTDGRFFKRGAGASLLSHAMRKKAAVKKKMRPEKTAEKLAPLLCLTLCRRLLGVSTLLTLYVSSYTYIFFLIFSFFFFFFV